MKTLKNLHMGALGTLVAVAALAGCNQGPDTATSESSTPPASSTAGSGTTTSPGTSGYVGPGSSSESQLQNSPNSTAGAAGPTGGSDLTAPGTTDSSSPGTSGYVGGDTSGTTSGGTSGSTGTLSDEEMRNRSGSSGSSSGSSGSSSGSGTSGSGTSGSMGPNSSLSPAERQFRDVAGADSIEKQLAAWRERYGVKLVQVEDRQGDARMSGSGSSGMGMTQNNPDKPAKFSRSERKFIEKAAVGGMFEVEAARLAEQKASDPQVKQLAAKMMEQHQQANNELKQIADARGVTLPTQLPSKEQRKIDDLAKQSGQKFDEEFLKTAGRKDHQQDIKDFEKARRDTKDPQLQAWIDKTLPALHTHLTEAQSLSGQARMQGYGGSGSAPSGTSGSGTSGPGGGSSMSNPPGKPEGGTGIGGTGVGGSGGSGGGSGSGSGGGS